jgi:carboxypeptidase Q
LAQSKKNFKIMRKLILILVTVFIGQSLMAQTAEQQIRKIFDEALTKGESYENLRVLCKEVGARLSGSLAADQAVYWGENVMEGLGLDSIWLQEVMVPKWKRGNIEKAITNKGEKLSITALGGSIGTPTGGISGDLIEVKSFEELNRLGKEAIAGKIVFFNRPMEAKHISTFAAYGGCVNQRGSGASEASKLGAIAVIVRSMNLREDDFPHTGGLRYQEGVNKIPGVAVSTLDANKLARELQEGKKVSVELTLNCQQLADVKSFNVIGELRGSVNPNQIITVGGHLDSWDIGEGAHDDGAGVVQSMEVLRILKAIGYKPKNTIRAVLFMNEENGNRGGEKYAAEATLKKEQHLAAVESDRGGFSPRAFSMMGNGYDAVNKWIPLFKPYGVYEILKGFAGVDIGPLKKSFDDIVLIGLVPDSQRYFDYHHSADDVFENVNKRELELGGAAMTTLIYLIDDQGLAN